MGDVHGDQIGQPQACIDGPLRSGASVVDHHPATTVGNDGHRGTGATAVGVRCSRTQDDQVGHEPSPELPTSP